MKINAPLASFLEMDFEIRNFLSSYLNSDADVMRKLEYVTNKKREAYAIAWNFANSKQVNEWNKVQKTLQREYYNKWYAMYN